MKIKLGGLRELTANLYPMQKNTFPVKISYAIMRNIEALENEFSSFEKQRIELCKTYANKDSDGNPVIKDGTYDIPSDVREDFNNELKELSDEEVDIDIRTVSAEEFEKCEQADRYDIPTGEDFAVLRFMLKD